MQALREADGVITQSGTQGGCLLHPAVQLLGNGLSGPATGLGVLLFKCTEDRKEESVSAEHCNSGGGFAAPAKRRRVITEIVEQLLGLLQLPASWAQQAAPTLAELRACMASSLQEPLALVNSWELKYSWGDSPEQVAITSDAVLQALVSSWCTYTLQQGVASGGAHNSYPKVYIYADQSRSAGSSPAPGLHPILQQMQQQRQADGNSTPATPAINSSSSDMTFRPSPTLNHMLSAQRAQSPAANDAPPSAAVNMATWATYTVAVDDPVRVLTTGALHAQQLQAADAAAVAQQVGSPSSRRSVAVPNTPFSSPSLPARGMGGPTWDVMAASGGQSLMDLHVDGNGAAAALQQQHQAVFGASRLGGAPTVFHAMGAGVPSQTDQLPPIRTLRPDAVGGGQQHGQATRMVMSGEGVTKGSMTDLVAAGATTVTTGGMQLLHRNSRHSSQPPGLDSSGGGGSPPPPPMPFGVTISTSTALATRPSRALSTRTTAVSGGGGVEEGNEEGGGRAAARRKAPTQPGSAMSRGRRGSSVSLVSFMSGDDQQLDGRPSTNNGQGDEDGEEEEDDEEEANGKGKKKGAARAKNRRTAKGRESDTKFSDGRKKDDHAHAASMTVMVDACATMFRTLSHLVEVVDYKHIRCLACSSPTVVKAYSAYHTACIRKHFLRHHQNLLAEGGADPNHFKEYKVSSKPSGKLGGSTNDLENLASTAAGLGSNTNISGLDPNQALNDNVKMEEGDAGMSPTGRRAKRQAASNVSLVVAAEAAASGRGGGARSGGAKAARSAGTPKRSGSKSQIHATPFAMADGPNGDPIDNGTPQSSQQRASPFQDAAKLAGRGANKHLAIVTGALPSRLSAGPSSHLLGNGGGSGAWLAPHAPGSPMLQHQGGGSGGSVTWRSDSTQPWVVTGGAGLVGHGADGHGNGGGHSSPVHMMIPGSPGWPSGPPPVTTMLGPAASLAASAWGGALSQSQRLSSSFTAGLDNAMLMPTGSGAPMLLPCTGSGAHDLSPGGASLAFPDLKASPQQGYGSMGRTGYDYRSGGMPVTSGGHLRATGAPGLSEPSRLGRMVTDSPLGLSLPVADHTHSPLRGEPREPGLPSPLSGPGYASPYGYDSMDPQSMVDFLSSLKKSADWTSQLASIRDQAGLVSDPSLSLGGGTVADGGADTGTSAAAAVAAPAPAPPVMGQAGAGGLPGDGLMDPYGSRRTSQAPPGVQLQPQPFGGHMFSGEGTIVSAGALMQAMNQQRNSSLGGAPHGANGQPASPALPQLTSLDSVPAVTWQLGSSGGAVVSNSGLGDGGASRLAADGVSSEAPWPQPNMMLDSGSLEPVRHSSLAATDTLLDQRPPSRQAQPLLAGVAGAALAVAGMDATQAVPVTGNVPATEPAAGAVLSEEEDDAPGFGFCSDKLMNYSYAQLLRVHPELGQDTTPESSGGHHA